jgi:hypothetical protein
MSSPEIDSAVQATDFIIQGLTSAGRQFRPSDWADRLCGIMSRFHPGQSHGFDNHLRYSPYVTPTLIEGVRSVLVDGRLHELEPLAYLFMRDFARDNDLKIIDACLLPSIHHVQA